MLLKMRIRKFNYLIIPGMVVIVLIIVGFISAIVFPQSQTWANKIQTMLDKHGASMLMWRLSLLVVIFITWPLFIKRKARIQSWPAINTKRGINLRWYIVVFLLLVDVLFQWLSRL